jgi:hypothetical protein
VLVVGAGLACVTSLVGAIGMGASLIVLQLCGMGATPKHGPLVRTTRSLEVRLASDGYRDLYHRAVVVDESPQCLATQVERVEVRRIRAAIADHFRVYLVLRRAVIDVTGTGERDRALGIAQYLSSALGKEPEAVASAGDVIDGGLAVSAVLGLLLLGAFACAMGTMALHLVLAMEHPRPLAALVGLFCGVVTSQGHLAFARWWRGHEDLAIVRRTFGIEPG